jgi:hypothetical protein
MNGIALWILFGAVVVGTVAAVVPLGLHARRLFKTARRTQGELLPLVDGLTQRADRAAQQAAVLGDKGQVLNEHIASLQGSIARVTVLLQALQEASTPWARLRRYVR